MVGGRSAVRWMISLAIIFVLRLYGSQKRQEGGRSVLLLEHRNLLRVLPRLLQPQPQLLFATPGRSYYYCSLLAAKCASSIRGFCAMVILFLL